MPLHNRSIHLAVSGVLLWACAAQASNDAPITRVTLYPGSATIERIAKVPAGAAQAEVTCVPANFDAHSLRVEPSTGVRVGTVTVQELDAQKSELCRHSELDTRVQALEARLDQLTADSQANDLASNYLKTLSEHVAGASDAKLMALPSGSTLAASTEALTRNARDVFANQQRLQRQKDEVSKQLEPLRKQRDQAASQRSGERAIVISVGASQAGELHISYQVNNAGWTPAYRANLLTSASTVQLERLAVVAQRTGEDWRHVELRLSTGKPQLAPSGPEPMPWSLSVLEPSPLRQRSFATAMAAAPAPIAAAAAQSDTYADTPLFPVSTIEDNFTTDFLTPHPVDLQSDGQQITIALSQQIMPVKLLVRATPSLNTNAYLVATGDPLSGVWPTGNVLLLRDGAAVGSTPWRPASSERMSLPFGKDELVRVKVEPAATLSGTTGVLTSRNEKKVGRHYSITNLHKQSVDVELLEATPVSADEKITVQPTFSTPPTAKDWENRPGVMAWLSTLDPQKSLSVDVTYVITYPKDVRVMGLP